MDWKNTLKKAWYFIWEDDSILSWLVNIVLAFVLIKFLVYPGLGLLLGTTHPVVAVVSGSMEHDGSFSNWWESQKGFYDAYNITDAEFKDYRFNNGFNKGDIMILKGVAPEDIRVGDVLVYRTARPDPIIHRTIKIYADNGKLYFQAKGDHNYASNQDETRISEGQIVGRAFIRVPLLGWIKIGFVELLKLVIP
ncbi:MAG: signal peptidase I [Candidatus Woesearchaeota archaeon]